MGYEKILYAVSEGGVATVTLNDPETRNALGKETLDELIAAFEAARDDAGVRCVVLASSHPRVFSAGADLEEFAADLPLVEKHLGSGRFPRLFRLIGELGKPTVCAVGGHALAGALGLALACDLIVATETAVFATPEIDVGVFPFMIGALIYRNVPRKRATEMLLLGERISASEARELGFVNKVVAADELGAAVGDWSRKLAAKSPIVMRLGKNALFRADNMAFDDALEYLHHSLTLALTTEDAAEGAKAFFERRAPEWRNR